MKMNKKITFEQRLAVREYHSWIKVEDYYIEDIKGRIVRVKKYNHIDKNIKRVKEHRSFQDKNLLNSVTLHKEMSK